MTAEQIRDKWKELNRKHNLPRACAGDDYLAFIQEFESFLFGIRNLGGGPSGRPQPQTEFECKCMDWGSMGCICPDRPGL